LTSGRIPTVQATAERSARRALLRRLTDVEASSASCIRPIWGKALFIEGTDMLVPKLDEIVLEAASAGVREVFFGMAHRGRLNVMTHVLANRIRRYRGFRRRQVATETNENDPPSNSPPMSNTIWAPGCCAANRGIWWKCIGAGAQPDHLEAVNPVVEGMTRATQM